MAPGAGVHLLRQNGADGLFAHGRCGRDRDARDAQGGGAAFFPAYLWLTTRCLCEQTEFRLAEREGQLGYYDTLTPLYATFHEDNHTFSLMWTPYDADFRAFHADYLDNQRRYGGNHGVLAQADRLPPENAYTVSCVPWIGFRHFAVHTDMSKPY